MLIERREGHTDGSGLGETQGHIFPTRLPHCRACGTLVCLGPQPAPGRGAWAAPIRGRREHHRRAFCRPEIRSYPREPPDSRNQARSLLAAVQEVRPFLGVRLRGQRSEGQIVTRDDKPDERRLPKKKRCAVPQWHHLPAWTPPRRVTVFPHSVRLYSNIS